MNTRFLKTVLLSGGMVAAISFPAFAGTWVADTTGWKYLNNDGSYSVSCWQWIDGNNDGTAECYYFNADGNMAVNTAIDGYTVDANGAWTVNGAIQTQAAAPTDTQTNTQTDTSSSDTTRLDTAREALREAGRNSYNGENKEELEQALFDYLNALGFDTSGLAILEHGISFGGYQLSSSGSGRPLSFNNDTQSLFMYYALPGYTWFRDDEGEFYKERLTVYGVDDIGNDGYATNLIQALEK